VLELDAALKGIVGRVHDRMPAILKPEAESLWLDLDTMPE